MNRVKRDTVENLYKSCRLGGDCPPDVVNKVERKTLADILLQAFSSIIYLGGIGIGTGKGSTGNVGVRPAIEIPPRIPTITDTNVVEEIPLEELPVRPSKPSTTTKEQRPFSVPIDRIGAGFRPKDPGGVKPIDVIDPASPSIITLQESLPDTIITIGEPNLETGDSTLLGIDIITDTTSIKSHPTVIQGVEENIAILTVSPADPPPTEVIFSIPELPADSLVRVQSVAGHIDPSFNVYVDPNITGDDIVFGEEISLEPINPRLEFEIEELPTASTPEQRLQNAFSRVRQFYNRHIQQVRTRNLNLLGDVSKAVTFGFENPAFDPEVSLEFEQDVNALKAAPDSDFANLQRISRPYISSTPEGTVRVSRLGQRAGMRTRSGTVLSQNIHYYFDISDIPNLSGAETIELYPISENPIDNVAINELEESVFVNEVDEAELMDVSEPTFQDAHLILNVEEEGDVTTVPILVSDIGFRALPIVTDIFVSEANNNTNTIFNIPAVPYEPGFPNKDRIVLSEDYYLHPSLRKRKRRRKKTIFVF